VRLKLRSVSPTGAMVGEVGVSRLKRSLPYRRTARRRMSLRNRDGRWLGRAQIGTSGPSRVAPNARPIIPPSGCRLPPVRGVAQVARRQLCLPLASTPDVPICTRGRGRRPRFSSARSVLL